MEEAEKSLREALDLILRFNRERTAEAFHDARVVKRETITVRDYSRHFPHGRGRC
jgi:hypothetical protein